MKLYDLECKLVHETEHAVLVTVDDKHKAWLPKAAIEVERKPGSNRVIITAPESLLIDKELV
jgi:predicted molibdopterin-dependent oxidoreductase YjgC